MLIFFYESIFRFNYIHSLIVRSFKKIWLNLAKQTIIFLIFRRSTEIKFKITQNEPIEVHAFAGFFKAVLYNDIVIGITPDLGENKMDSWFPYIFPLKVFVLFLCILNIFFVIYFLIFKQTKDPIEVKKGDFVVFNLERKSIDNKVWYEWCVTEPKLIEIHNACGRSFTIG